MSEIKELNGIIKSKFDPKTRGKWTVTDFILKTDSGDVKCSTFNNLPADLLGERVTIKGKPNEYKGQVSYTVTGDIKKIGGAAVTTTSTNVPQTTTVSATPVQEVTPQVAREDNRPAAEASVTLNLESAKAIADKLGIKATGEVLVSLADMVGRTMTAIQLDNKRKY